MIQAPSTYFYRVELEEVFEENTVALLLWKPDLVYSFLPIFEDLGFPGIFWMRTQRLPFVTVLGEGLTVAIRQFFRLKSETENCDFKTDHFHFPPYTAHDFYLHTRFGRPLPKYTFTKSRVTFLSDLLLFHFQS